MNESELLTQGVRLGQQVMKGKVIAMLMAKRSTDRTDTDYSLSNTMTISEVIAAVQEVDAQ